MKDKTFLTLTIVFFFVLIFVIAELTLDKPLSKTLRASSVAPSPLKSFAVVFPQVVQTGVENGEIKPQTVKVSVIIRDKNGELLPDRSVKLTSSLDATTIKPSDTQITNNIGQAIFYVSSSAPGTVKFSAFDVASEMEIANIPSVDFTQ